MSLEALGTTCARLPYTPQTALTSLTMRPNIAAHAGTANRKLKEETKMSWKSKLVLWILTAVAMLLLSFALPRGGGSFLRDAQAAQFPVTVGVWAIFVLLFVKLK
jgi:hypothetical protein